jgi:hypothetical protein
MGCRIRTEREVVPFSSVAQVIENNTWLNPSNSLYGIDLQNPVQVLRHVQHKRNVAALSGERCPSAAGKNGRAKLSSQSDRSNYILAIAGKNNSNRNLPVIGAVGRIERTAAIVETNFSSQVPSQCST